MVITRTWSIGFLGMEVLLGANVRIEPGTESVHRSRLHIFDVVKPRSDCVLLHYSLGAVRNYNLSRLDLCQLKLQM